MAQKRTFRGLLGRLPVVHQLRQSVGLQRGMLVAGLIITGDLPAHRDLRAAARAVRLRAAARRRRRCSVPSSRRAREHLVRHDGRRLRRALARDLGRADRVPGDHRRGAAVDLRRHPARPGLRLPRRLARPRARGDRGRGVRVPDAAARDRRGHRDQRRAVEPVGRHHGGGDLDHRRLHPAVLPRDPRRDDPGEVGGVRRVGEGDRGERRRASCSATSSATRPAPCR